MPPSLFDAAQRSPLWRDAVRKEQGGPLNSSAARSDQVELPRTELPLHKVVHGYAPKSAPSTLAVRLLSRKLPAFACVARSLVV